MHGKSGKEHSLPAAGPGAEVGAAALPKVSLAGAGAGTGANIKFGADAPPKENEAGTGAGTGARTLASSGAAEVRGGGGECNHCVVCGGQCD
jgi:hypothetical protein